jgi:hypothetical protein
MSVERNDVYQAMWWLEHQRIFFFGAFIIGAILILTLKFFDISSGIISALAVALMLIYAATGVRNKLKVRLDVLGDNLYYLGFLYTLVSLSYSLYTLGKGTADINDLLENFGLAIMTTLAGLALRVFFNQPKADIFEYENTIRLSLTEATANFVAEASKIGTDISTLRTVLSQVVQETQEAQRISNNALSEAVNDQIGLLDKTSNKNQENIQNLLAKMESVQNNFTQNFELNTSAMKKVMTSSMRNIEKGAENFTANFENMAGPINDLGDSINSMVTLMQSWDAAVQRLLTTDTLIQEKIQKSSENLNAAQSNFITIVEDLPKVINKAIDNIDNVFDGLKQRTLISETEVEHNRTQLNASIAKIVGEIEKLAEQIDQQRSKFNFELKGNLTTGSKDE